jgi:hypothetical protein
MFTNKTLFSEFTQQDPLDYRQVIPLNNTTKVYPSIILMTANEPETFNISLFMHKFQTKHELATLIMDNGNQKNIMAQYLVYNSTPCNFHPHINLGRYKRAARILLYHGVVK